jgi:hypothetical protein
MNKSELPSLEDYKKMIQSADWYYQYADGAAYRRGEAQVRRIHEIAAASEPHKEILAALRK